MKRALIGHTGFVGSNLQRQRPYDACFNSRSIGEIEGQSFERLVCAGVSAVKWWANQNPAEDRIQVEALQRHLLTVSADLFILISTVDVYATPLLVTEDDEPSDVALHPYGLHRLRLEHFVAERFPRHLIVRLPALFGTGLKKNALYDLIHDHRCEAINPAGEFQWYPLDRLTTDLDRLEAAELSVMNMATRPLSMASIQQRFFPLRRIGPPGTPGGRYDMRTRHANVLNGTGDYIMTAPEVMSALADFLAAQ